MWGLPLFEVDDTLWALGALAAFHRSRFSIPVAAVGGSAGKTTTKEMVAAILRTRGPALATEGNFNNEIGVPLTLLRLRSEHRAAVVELGMSTPGELQRITAMARPDAGVLTLVAAEHLEFLKDLDGVAEAEGELYRGLLPGSVAVVNADDARCLTQAERVASGVKKIFFGKSAVADVRLSRVTALGGEGQEICLEGEEWDGYPGGVGVSRRRPTAPQSHRQAGVRGGAQRHECGGGGGHGSRALIFIRRNLPWSLFGPAVRASIAARGRRGGDHDPRRLLQRLARIHGRCAGDARKPERTRIRPRDRGAGRHARAGEAEEASHRALGRRACESGVAVAAFFGPRSSLTFKEFSSSCSSSSSSAHFTEIEPLLAWLRPRLQPGDTVLVKGSRGMMLERVVDALVAAGGGPP